MLGNLGIVQKRLKCVVRLTRFWDMLPRVAGLLSRHEVEYARQYAVVLQIYKEFRKKSGITQIELAKKVGTTQSMISKIERGKRRLDIVDLRLLLNAMGKSLQQFLGQLEFELQKPFTKIKKK